MVDFAPASAHFASSRPFPAKALPPAFSLSRILPMNQLNRLRSQRNPHYENNVNLISSKGRGGRHEAGSFLKLLMLCVV